MEIDFSSKKLAKQCDTEKSRTKAFGQERAKRLGRRLTALVGATNLGDLKDVPGRLHALRGDRAGQLSFDLDGPHRLIFEPVTNPDNPVNCADPAEWSKITHIRLLGIEDTHE